MKNKKMESLFLPKSVAIVGASNKKGKIGKVIANNVRKLGYRGKVFLVNPSYKFIGLKKCYPALSAIGEQVDVAIICIPAKFVFDVVKDGSKNVKNFVIISAGFSETGKEGAEREKKLLEFAEKEKINILGPNCLGFIVPSIKLNASFAGGMPKSGNIAFVSQSGALAVALMDKATGENLGFSNVVSIGNKMQVDESELLKYLSSDKQTKVIGMYLEGIKNGVKFLETARSVSKDKPIVILKAGKTAKAQQAISSHTGALAGSDEIIDIAFGNAGIIRADDLEEFFNLLSLISFAEAPKNNKVAVITNAGGAGVLTTDAFKGKSIELAEFDEKIKEKLKKNLPEESSIENPIDLLGDAGEKRYEVVLDSIEGTAGSIIAVLTPQEQTPVEKIVDVIVAEKKKSEATAVSIFIGGERVAESIKNLKNNGIPNFSGPEQAVKALDKYCKWKIFSGKGFVTIEEKKPNGRTKETEKIISQAKEKNRKSLLFSEAAEIMEKYDISCVRSYALMPDSNLPEIKEYPVVIKVDSDKVLHKSDKQALILNIKDKSELEKAVKNLRKNFPAERLIIQDMQQDKGVEIIIGIKKDETFGPVVVYGLGGIYTEVFKMVDFLIPPMGVDEIKENVMNSKIQFLFKGARGQNQYDLEEFARIISGIIDFAKENKNVKEFDINPLFIYNNGKKACAVDVKIII